MVDKGKALCVYKNIHSESIAEKNLLGEMNVGKPSICNVILLSIRQYRNLINVMMWEGLCEKIRS